MTTGRPLNSFLKNTRAGQIGGEGITTFGAEWSAIPTGGSIVEKYPTSGIGY